MIACKPNAAVSPNIEKILCNIAAKIVVSSPNKGFNKRSRTASLIPMPPGTPGTMNPKIHETVHDAIMIVILPFIFTPSTYFKINRKITPEIKDTAEYIGSNFMISKPNLYVKSFL